ncbi:MAG: glycogen synthase GlgA [Candidatus Zixiibacteriota bacterium]
MKKSQQVVLVSAEVFPFAKAGGLADVMGTLPKDLAQKGIEPIIFMPLYSWVKRDKYGIKKIEDCKIDIDTPDGIKSAELYQSVLPNTNIQIIFVYNHHYFDRDGLYNDPETGLAYPDDGERFTFFSRIVPIAIKKLGLKPQVIHCNDYQTALIAVYLKKIYNDDEILGDTKFVFSIHNLAYQGIYEPSILDYVHLGYQDFYPAGPFEYYGKVNFMKLGILYADMITTVSPTYSKEIQTKEYGYGLDGVLRSRKENLVGILNGVDYHIWNPLSDPYLNIHYDSNNISGKKALKKQLLQESDISEDRIEMPLLGMVSRLADQKGFDILIDAIPEFIERDVTIVILGTGVKRIESALKELSEKYKDRFRIHLLFSPKMAHLIEAGSDMFLMPSRYEPCGLNQMYSLKYGTIPIVRKTGGLADTITDVDEIQDGVGFAFEEYNSDKLAETIHRALDIFNDKERWREIIQRAMKCDFSWKASASKYVKLYEGLVLRPLIKKPSDSE